jgi:hypothetical protein
MKNTLLLLGLLTAVSACAGEAKQDQPTVAKELHAPGAANAAPAAGTAAASPSVAAEPTVEKPAAAAAAPAAAESASAPAAASGSAAEDRKPAYREITIPAGTSLPLTLRTAVSSETSRVEDTVRATLRAPIKINGVEALPEGTAVIGHVTDAARSARVKGRARIAFRFTRIDAPGESGQMAVRTGTVARVAQGTKKQDAAKIGGGAVGGAIIGGILGGGDGAAKGAAIGGAGGTGVVLATRGKEVGLAAGAPVSVKLTAPLVVRVRAN